MRLRGNYPSTRCRLVDGCDPEALLSNTWNAVALWALRDGPRRPVELRERIGGISSKVLTETLRRLQVNGLVDRQEHPDAASRAEYHSPLWEAPCWRPSTRSAHGPSSTAMRSWPPRKQHALPIRSSLLPLARPVNSVSADAAGG